YEMAFRMQSSVPDLTDVSKEPKHILDSYGPDVLKPGTYAANCLLARRMAERDVRCIQLFHMGWDHHGGLPNAVKGQCRDTDQPTAALIADLRQRGLLEDTLIVWGGEFGRTIYSQGKLTATNYGRDHHPRCFTVFLAGAGVKKGFSLGTTDDYCYNITEDPVHVHDLNATIMHLLGVDHKKLTYRFQGRDYRLTDIHGHLVKKILA
ncbi:MAG TPA: sulfatase, partial [Opitutae bacterium]|nr:sulfatase [Opitutae bacterium]